jgi:ketosteroid isomerase-like protein
MSAADEVREASKKFYAGLNRMINGVNNALVDAWSHNSKVTSMHPIGGREIGWDKVNDSFNQVGKMASEGKVELKDQLINVYGDTAYELGIEKVHAKLAGNEIKDEVRVTNIYRKDGGAWNMIHHHSDTSPAMLELLSRLQAASGMAKK